MSAEKKQKERFRRPIHPVLMYLEYIPLWLLCRFLLLLPETCAYKLVHILFRLLPYFDWKHYNRMCRNLRFAKVATNDKEAHEIALKVYRHFGMLLVEIIKFQQLYHPDRLHLCGDAETIRRCVSHNHLPAEQPVILVTAHYGNWELETLHWPLISGIKMSSIMRPFTNPLIGEMILSGRRNAHHSLVNKNGGIRDILRALKRKECVALLVDQHASSNEAVQTVFFGRKCQTHVSPAVLHLRTGVPIMPMITRRVGDRFEFEVELGKLIEYTPTGDKTKDLQVIAQMYTSALEEMIRKAPEQWMWAHRRWRGYGRKKRKKSGKRN